MEKEFSNKVSSLFDFGTSNINQEWPDYVKTVGLSQVHIPELIRLILNSNLEAVTSGSTVEEYAPMHAWRALGQLADPVAVKPLLQALADEKNEEAFWYSIEIKKVLSLIGPPAIPEIKSFLAGDDIEWDLKKVTLEALTKIVFENRTFRSEVVSILIMLLQDYQTNYSGYNASIIKELCDLNAVESASLVQEVVLNNKVDYEFVKLEDIEKIIED